MDRERSTPDLGLELSRSADDRKLIERQLVKGRPVTKPLLSVDGSDLGAALPEKAIDSPITLLRLCKPPSIVYSIPQFFKNPGKTMGSSQGKIISTAGGRSSPATGLETTLLKRQIHLCRLNVSARTPMRDGAAGCS